MPAPNTRTFTQKLARRGSRSKVQHGVKLICVTVIAAFIAACAPAEPTPSQSAQSTAVESPDTNETSATDATEPRAAESATAEPPEAQYDSEALSPPVLPEAAKEYSEEGAIAFMEYTLSVINYTLATGDTTPISSISTPDCSFCTHIIHIGTTLNTAPNSVEGYSASGRNYQFGGYPEDTPELIALSFDLAHSEHTVISNGTTKVEPATQEVTGVHLSWQDKWLLAKLGKAVK